MPTAIPDFELGIAFESFLEGVLLVDGGAIDVAGLFDDNSFQFLGTFDEVTDDLVDGVQITVGTDNLAGAVQAGSMTFNLLRPSDLSYYNPNNPSSPLATVSPGFVPMRPVRLQATQDATTAGLFFGFIRKANWDSDSCSCAFICEDLLLWASRLFPIIPSTGPTKTGAAIGKILDAIGWVNPTLRELDDGDDIDDFSADGTRSATQLIADLLAAERGTVYHRGDAVVVYEDRTRIQTRAVLATLDDELVGVQSGIDVDTIFTRASVTKTGGITATAANPAAELIYGRADYGAIDSPYIPSDDAAAALADDLVYEKSIGKPPLQLDLDNGDAATLAIILDATLLSAFAVDETLGETSGEYIVQQITYSVRPGYLSAQYLATKRFAKAFTVDGSPFDSADVLRY